MHHQSGDVVRFRQNVRLLRKKKAILLDCSAMASLQGLSGIKMAEILPMRNLCTIFVAIKPLSAHRPDFD
jgi:hypothetical protein